MYKNHKLIGLCIARIQEEGNFVCVRAINKHAVENGYRILVFNSCSDLYAQKNADEKTESQVFSLIPYDILDAMIIFGESIRDDSIINKIVTNCHTCGIPAITIDYHVNGCINFAFDYSNAFEKLCRHIIEDHGFKRVNMIAGYKGNRFSDERIDAYKRALRENGIPFKSAYLGYGDFWDEPTIAVMEKWFDCENPDIPQAIICANDTMAVTAGRFLQNRGYHIPEDIVITGFDGIMEAEYFIPPITTCTQDYETLGKEIIKVIEKHSAGEPFSMNHSIAFHMKKAQSCGCINTMPYNTNMMMSNLLERLKRGQTREAAMCELQTAIGNMKTISQLREIIIDKFVFHSIVLAINEDIFRPPYTANKYKGDTPFSDNVNIICQRYHWVLNEPCIVRRSVLAPELEKFLEHTDPIIFCVVHFVDLVLGYCVMQPEMQIIEYEKVNSFMYAIDSALGIFRNRMNIKYINTQLTSANDELEKLYIHDHLTGLFNRRGFYRQFEEQYESANERRDLFIIIISADLDELKHINDTYGHKEGDNAIITVGHALVTSAIQGEICSRFGGDEFTVAGIVSYSPGYFESFKKRFRSCLDEYNKIAGKPYSVEASIGFCAQPVYTQLSLEQMIKLADDMMYQDKVNRKKLRRS